jgi:hypothetical protein
MASSQPLNEVFDAARTSPLAADDHHGPANGFRSRQRGGRVDGPPSTGRFFIAGCQRSGTTLLRLVLECHPAVFCYDETQAYRRLAANDYAAPPGKSLLGFKIPRWTEQLAEDRLCDQGMEEQAGRFYQRDPILFMLRDARDVVASMMQLKAGGDSWLEIFGRQILAAKMASPAFRERFANDIAYLESTGLAHAAVGALYWKYKTQAFFDYRDRAWPVHGVCYESLATDPEAQLRAVASFLRLTWQKRLLKHPRFPHGELAPCGYTVGHTDPQRPIDSNSVGQWHHVLTAEQEADVMTIAEDLMERMESAVS